jgi:hypothetical protein
MKQRSTRSKLLLTCGAGLAGLLVAELLVRVLDLAPHELPEPRGTVLRRAADPRLRFENHPGSSQELVYFDAAGAERSVIARINSQGFRGPEVALDKHPRTLRIACIGDSHTFGYGVGDSETWPAVLQELLDGGETGLRVEVLNFGVQGYDTQQEVVLPLRAGDVAEPAPDWLAELTTPHRPGVVRRLRSVSELADLACDWVFRKRYMAHKAELWLDLYSDESPGWEQVRYSLDLARRSVAETGAPFGVVLFPLLAADETALLSHTAFAKVREFCRRSGIACFDPEAAFAGLELEELWVHERDVHANAAGHRIFASAVAGWLRREGPLLRAIARLEEP